MSTPTTELPAEIIWTLVSTDDWGGGLERTYRAENVEHAGCGGDVHLVHLHDPLGAILGMRSYCAKCDEDLTATKTAEADDDRPEACGESGCICYQQGHPDHADCACGCDCPRYTNDIGQSVIVGAE